MTYDPKAAAEKLRDEREGMLQELYGMRAYVEPRIRLYEELLGKKSSGRASDGEKHPA